jgi:hypothetical protein
VAGAQFIKRDPALTGGRNVLAFIITDFTVLMSGMSGISRSAGGT